MHMAKGLVGILAISVFMLLISGFIAGTSKHFLKEKQWLIQETKQKEKLLALIRSESAYRFIAPDNARLDRVWKAIPGYNGLEVDVDQTFERASSIRMEWDPADLPFIYREVEPAIHLDDLGIQPIYKGNPNKRMVSIMINVAWGNEYLLPMLKILEQEAVHATFFLDGSWLSKNIDLARSIKLAGHEISNHAYSHRNMSQLSKAQATEEIMKTEKLLAERLEIHNTLFAPPSGDYNLETVKIAADLHLRTILWTIDTVDWQKPAPEWIIRKVITRLEPGSLVLMHPTESSSLALERLIQEIKAKGYVLGTVSELLSSARVPDYVQYPIVE